MVIPIVCFADAGTTVPVSFRTTARNNVSDPTDFAWVEFDHKTCRPPICCTMASYLVTCCSFLFRFGPRIHLQDGRYAGHSFQLIVWVDSLCNCERIPAYRIETRLAGFQHSLAKNSLHLS